MIDSSELLLITDLCEPIQDPRQHELTPHEGMCDTVKCELHGATLDTAILNYYHYLISVLMYR